MGIHRMQICWQGPGGGADDRYCNTFHFDASELLDFYAGSPSWGIQIVGIMIDNPDGFYKVWCSQAASSYLVQGPVALKIYRLTDPEPRAPVFSWTGSPGMSWGDGDDLPAEVAICLSIEAIAVAGTNRARRRGRLYLGPLSSSAVSTSSAGPEVNDDAASAILTAWDNAVREMELRDFPLGIYSPTDSLFLPVETAWVDNAFDTQRRRGLEPSRRTTWTHP